MSDPRVLRVVIDTREQCPWTFPRGVVVVASRKLRAGDYAPDGFEDEISIERKSLDDLVRSLFHERARFDAEIALLSSMSYASIIVESGLDDVLRCAYRSRIPARTVLDQVASVSVVQRVPVLFAGTRANAAALADVLMRCAVDVVESRRAAGSGAATV